MNELTLFTHQLLHSPVIWIATATVSAVFLGLLISYLINRKHLSDTVIQEKILWHRTLTQDIAEFCALATQHYFKVKELSPELAEMQFAADVKQLNQLRVKVRLSLSPNKTIDSADLKLIRTMNRIILHFESKHYDNLHRELLRVERCAQQLLYRQWKLLRHEAESGQRQSPRNH